MSSKFKQALREPQNVIAIGVTVISLCALIVSLMQTSIMKEERELMREYSRKSVWPRLEWRTYKAHNTKDQKLRQYIISLSNNGIGPAIITDVKITYDGKLARTWWDVFKHQGIPDSIRQTISNKNFNGRIFKVGETVEILDLSDNLPLAEEFFKRDDGLKFEIYFESIYEEKWRYDSNGTTPLELFTELPFEEQFR